MGGIAPSAPGSGMPGIHIGGNMAGLKPGGRPSFLSPLALLWLLPLRLRVRLRRTFLFRRFFSGVGLLPRRLRGLLGASLLCRLLGPEEALRDLDRLRLPRSITM